MLASPQSSPVTEFLHELFETGRVRVAEETATPAELAGVDELLLAFDGQCRRELAGEPPRLDLPAARWAAASFYRACQYVAHRHLGVAKMRATLTTECPGAKQPSAAVHYAVDLTFRYLPDLTRLARTTSEGDPLLVCLHDWARQWPLSSVGVMDIVPDDAAPILNDACLLSLYVDRVIERRDLPRLSDPRVADAARQALGLFPELAPEVAAALEQGHD
jgi:hypothetical protein